MFGNTKDMIWLIALAAIGIYTIFKGIKTILTGSLTAREEARLTGYSDNGVRLYKKAYAVISIFGGLLALALAVVVYLGSQNIIADTLPYKLGFLAVAVVMAAILLAIQSKCKKM